MQWLYFLLSDLVPLRDFRLNFRRAYEETIRDGLGAH
jgi:hypothetical protein